MLRKLAVKASDAASCCKPSKKRAPSVGAAEYARLFKALGDETRVEIVKLLAHAGDEMCACDIESRFELSQSTISHHLRILRDATLVSSERRGTWVYYKLSQPALDMLPAFPSFLGT